MDINSISSSYAINTLSANQAATTASTGSGATSDSSQLSPMASLLNQLKQLQQNDPTQFKAVMSNIADTLNTDAQSASGSKAQVLTDLANKFSTAAQTGQMTDLQPAASQQAASGHHNHHHVSSYQDSSSATASGQNPNTIDLAQIIQTALQKSSG